MGGVTGQIEQHAGVDVQLDAQFVLDCGDPFVQHGPMLPDAGPGRGDVLPGVAVEGGERPGGDPGEVQVPREEPQGQAGEAAVRPAQLVQAAAQRAAPVGGDERLVASPGVGEERGLGAGVVGERR